MSPPSSFRRAVWGSVALLLPALILLLLGVPAVARSAHRPSGVDPVESLTLGSF